MSKKLSAQDAVDSMHAHAEVKGGEIHAKYGPSIGWSQIERILADRACVRYSCRVELNPAPLEPGEIACALADASLGEGGHTIYVHPYFCDHLDQAAWWVLYQLVVVNYGGFAAAAHAEVFGAAALGITREEYYNGLCKMADDVAAATVAQPGSAAVGPLVSC